MPPHMNHEPKYLQSVINKFAVRGKCDSIAPYGTGHINDTYLVDMADGGPIVQRVTLVCAQFAKKRQSTAVVGRFDGAPNLLQRGSVGRSESPNIGACQGLGDITKCCVRVEVEKGGVLWEKVICNRHQSQGVRHHAREYQ